MINLMPDDAKKELRAARINVLLLRYMFIIVLATAFLGLILFGATFLLDRTRISSQQLIDANDTKAEVYSATKAQVDTLSTSLSEAKGILDQEVVYSNVLMNIAQQMPAGTIIDEITLGSASFGAAPLTVKVYAKSTNDIVALQDSFKSSPLFSSVSFQTVSDTAGGIDGYPASATITLTLNKVATQ